MGCLKDEPLILLVDGKKHGFSVKLTRKTDVRLKTASKS
jgi:hypothetical protein